MCAITINVKEKINSPSALTREQGQIIYDDIISSFSKGDSVILDFADIESLITPFLNVAIGKLYEDYSSEELKQLLDIQNFPPEKVSSFNVVTANAKRFYA
ncbi:MAG: STAS-like domain-containing protein, partial [Lachnospiraceae bacterium]|nr:STAS-like domain-containing protein [Lachnospiraceae bacterium]